MVQTISGVKNNLWATQQSGLYAPKRMNFPLNGLVLYAPLWHPELSGSPFTSKDLNAHICTVTGALWTSKGRTFDGTDDEIRPADGTDFDLNIFSVLVWFKPAAVTVYHSLWSNINAAAEGGALWRIKDDDTVHFISADLEGIGQNSFVTTGTVDTSKFYHLGVTVPGTGGTLRQYIDGAEDGTKASQLVIPYAADSFPSIGEDATGGRDANGTMGEIAVWNRVLTAEEVSHHRNSTIWRYL